MKTIPSLRTLCFAILAALALSQGAVSADAPNAPITWGSAQNISGDNDIITTGSLVYAYNFGSSATSTTINGVAFSPFIIAGVSPITSITSGNVTLMEYPGQLSGYATDTNSVTPFIDLSSDYKTLLGSAAVATQDNTMTLQLGGLTPGKTYSFQWWSNDSWYWGNFGPTTANATNSVTLDANLDDAEGGIGQFAVGNFTAAGTSQSIAFDAFTFQVLPIINGFQLRTLASTLYWSGSNGTLWSAGNNWSSNATGTPTENFATSSDIVFSATGSSNSSATDLGGNLTIGSLTIESTDPVGISGGNLTINGTTTAALTVNATAGNVTIAAPLILSGSSSTLSIENANTTLASITSANGLVKTGNGTVEIQNRIWVSELGGNLDVQSGNFVSRDGLSLGVGASNETATISGNTTSFSSPTTLNVGYSGNGSTLAIENGASASAGSVWIGGTSPSENNRVTVNGTGSSLNSSVGGSIAVGYAGSNNSLSVSNGGSADSTTAYIGYESTANNNTATVAGSNSSWSNTGHFHIGYNGTGNTLSVANGGNVTTTTQDAHIGFNAGSNNNALSVNGTGSRFTTGGGNKTFYVGNKGVGNTLAVLGGGNLTTYSTRIGSDAASSNNTATISGNGSIWNNSNTLRVGSAGSGNTLAILNGGTLGVGGNAFLGYSAGSNNNLLTVNGTGSTLVGSELVVGRLGASNTLSVVNAGNATLSGNLAIGFDSASSNNTATVTGAGSTLSALNIQIGTGANNKLIISDSGLISTANIALAGTNATLQIGDGGAAGNLSLTGSILTTGTASGRSVIFNHTDSAYQFASGMGGDLAVLHSGNGTTTLTANNTYTGGTTISAGTLSIGDGGTTGSIAGNVINDAALAFNRSDNTTFAGEISGTGSVVKLGNGTTTLTADNIYTGTTTISAGTLQIGNGGTTGSVTGNITNNAALVFNRSNNSTFTGGLTGTGSLEKLGAGVLTLSGGNRTTGATTINGGGLTLANSSTLNATSAVANSGAITIGQGSSLVVSGSTPIFQNTPSLFVSNLYNSSISVFNLQNSQFLSSISGNMTSPAGLAIDGSGNIYAALEAGLEISKFSSNGTFLNTVPVSSYVQGLAFDVSGNLYAAHPGADTVSKLSSNGTLLNTIQGLRAPQGLAIDASGNIFVADNSADRISKISSNGTIVSAIVDHLYGPWALAVDENGNLFASNVNENRISKFSSNGTFLSTISANLSDTRGLAIDGSGNLYAANMGDGTVSKFSSNGTLLGRISGNMSGPSGLAIGNYTTANGSTPNGLALAENSSDTVTLNLGTYGGSDTTATLTAPFIAFGNGTAAFNLNLASNYTLSTALTGGGANSTINQLGIGTTTVTSANSTYAGTVNINSGTLAVTGSLANATTQVNSGGTLAGNGTLGAVIINDGGTIAPGNSPGNITVGNLTLNAGAIYNWQTSSNGTSGTAGTDWDLISSPGTLTLNATSGSPITINLSSLGNATLAGVKKTSWEIGNFTTGITGFDKNAFSFNAASMIGNAGSYFMSLGTGNLTLVLNYKTGAVWNTASGNWSTASQWEGNSLPENGDSIEFSGPGGLSTNNFASGNLSYISGISFLEGSGAYTVNGSTLQIKEDGIINSSNQTQTIAMDLTSNGLLTVNAASGNLVLSGVFSGNWQHNLEKTGNATLTLTGNNTYEGGTIISAGTLNVASAQALGTAGSITFGGGTLRYGEGITTDYSSRFANQEGQALLIDTWSPNNTVIFASNITAANGTLTKLGAGALVLRGNNSYNGGTVIAGGTLAAQSAMAFGTGNVDLNNNSVLAIGSFANGLANMALSVGGNLSWSSNTSTIALLNGASANITGSLSSNGVVGNRTFDVSQYGVVSNNTITLARFADSDILTSGTSTANATFDITFTGLSQSSTVTTTGNFVISDGVLKYLISSAIANGSSLDIRNSDADFIVDSPTTAGTTVVTGQNPLVKDVIFKGSNNLVVPTGVELTVFGQTGTAAGQLEVQNGTSSVVSGSGTIQAPNGLEKVGGGELDLQSNTNVTGIATVVEGLLSVNGQLATTGGVVVNPGATLGGTGVIFGNVVVNGNFSPGNSPGTETIIGNLVLTGANSTIIEIASPTNFDRIVVTGTATLGGTLNAVAYGGGTITPGARYDFLQAGSIVGTYDTLIAPDGLRVRFLNSGTVGTLLFGPASFVPYALNQNQINVAKALDEFVLATEGDALTVGIALDSLTSEQFPAAFDQIMPGFYESLGDILIEQTYNQAQLLTQRLGTVRLGATGFQAIGMNQPIKYDKDGKSAADAKTASPILEAPANTNWNSWVIANGEFSLSRGLSGVPNYNNNAGGFLVGADYRLSENFAAGLFAGYEYSYAKYDGGSSTRGNSALFGLYGSYTHEDGYYADAMVSGGYTGFQTRRSIQFGTIDRTASADPNSGQFSAALNLGKDFEIGKFTLGPIIGAQYTYAGIGGFTETGADSLDLALGQQNANSFRTNLGARLAYNWEVGSNITLIPEIRGFWMHEFLNNPRNISSSLEGGSGPSFDYETSAPYRNSVFGGVGISAKFADRWSASVFYNVNFGAEGYTNNIISTSLGFAF